MKEIRNFERGYGRSPSDPQILRIKVYEKFNVLLFTRRNIPKFLDKVFAGVSRRAKQSRPHYIARHYYFQNTNLTSRIVFTNDISTKISKILYKFRSSRTYYGFNILSFRKRYTLRSRLEHTSRAYLFTSAKDERDCTVHVLSERESALLPNIMTR